MRLSMCQGYPLTYGSYISLQHSKWFLSILHQSEKVVYLSHSRGSQWTPRFVPRTLSYWSRWSWKVWGWRKPARSRGLEGRPFPRSRQYTKQCWKGKNNIWWFHQFFDDSNAQQKAAFISLVRAIRPNYTVNMHTVNWILVSLLTRKYNVFSWRFVGFFFLFFFWRFVNCKTSTKTSTKRRKWNVSNGHCVGIVS